MLDLRLQDHRFCPQMFKACLCRSFFVGGLQPEVTREELLQYLSGFVTVDEIDIKLDPATGG